MSSFIENLINRFYDFWDSTFGYLKITGLSSILDQILIATAILLIIWGFIHLFFWGFCKKLVSLTEQWVPPIQVKDLELISPSQISSFISRCSKLLKTALLLVLIFVYLALLLSFFPSTRDVTSIVFIALFNLLLSVFRAVTAYIPNLFFIFLILFITHHILKIVNITSTAIRKGRISFASFHREWAEPTEKIIKFFVIVLSVIMVVPYLPGFDTPAFKGISIFLGIMLSLGSTAAIANIIAGMVLIYMRAFRIGDHVKINEYEGEIDEHSMLRTRIRTLKNRVITIPNSLILTSPIINYSILASDPGVVIYTSVTIGYDVPWQTVHEYLINAAKKTTHINQDPAPFILQKKLDDYSVAYELNAYTKESSKRPAILSELHQKIQDEFSKANIEILSPQYTAFRDGNELTLPMVKEKNKKS